MIEEIKGNLASADGRIRLYYLIGQLVQESASALRRISADQNTGLTPAYVREYVGAVEKAVAKVCMAQSLLAFWGLPAHRSALTLAMRHLASHASNGSWLEKMFHWYGLALVLYTSGVAAVAADGYGNLKEALHVVVPGHDGRQRKLVRAYGEWSKTAHSIFKMLPGNERTSVPISEHLFAKVNESLSPSLRLDYEYEDAFDRFEVILNLEHAHQYEGEAENGRYWAPTGRFRWKFTRDGDQSPFHRVASDGEQMKEAWLPIKHGLFQSSYGRFRDVVHGFGEFLSRIAF